VEAKRVAWGELSPELHLPKVCRKDLPASRSAAQQHHAKTIKNDWSRWFEASPRCQWLCSIDPSMPSAKFRKDTVSLACWQASLLIQLRTGHIPLRKHLYRIGKVDAPTFPTCNAGDKMVHHYLLACPVHACHRRVLELHLKRQARSVKTLLSNLKAFPHLFRFIHNL